MTAPIPSSTGPSKRSRRLSARRAQLREHIWPGSSKEIWDRKSNNGFTTIPRLLPLVTQLIRTLAKKGDPASVYFELWSRLFDEGIISNPDESSCAHAAGYEGPRAVRTWREHLKTLEGLGFIRTKPVGNREIGHILVLNPLEVCVRFRKERPADVPEKWWNAFVQRATEIGAELGLMEGEENADQDF